MANRSAAASGCPEECVASTTALTISRDAAGVAALTQSARRRVNLGASIRRRARNESAASRRSVNARCESVPFLAPSSRLVTGEPLEEGQMEASRGAHCNNMTSLLASCHAALLASLWARAPADWSSQHFSKLRSLFLPRASSDRPSSQPAPPTGVQKRRENSEKFTRHKVKRSTAILLVVSIQLLFCYVGSALRLLNQPHTASHLLMEQQQTRGDIRRLEPLGEQRPFLCKFKDFSPQKYQHVFVLNEC